MCFLLSFVYLKKVSSIKAMSLTPLEHQDACRIHDILSILPQKVRARLQKVSGYKQEKALISEEFLPKQVECKKHGGRCDQPHEDLLIAGSHCNDHSTAGNQAGKEGTTAVYFLVLCKHILDKRVPLILLENVVPGEFTEMVLLDLQNRKTSVICGQHLPCVPSYITMSLRDQDYIIHHFKF